MPKKPKQEAPASAESADELTVCQECLEREIGNWFDDSNPELIEMVYGYLSPGNTRGTCVLCGTSIYAELQSLPKYIKPWTIQTGFDCLSEEVEIEELSIHAGDTGFVPLN